MLIFFILANIRLFTVRYIFFRKIVRIERLTARAAILVSYVPRGGEEFGFIAVGERGTSFQTVPCPRGRFDTHPQPKLGTFETKMAACNA